MIAPIVTVRELAKALHISPIQYRRVYLSRKDHPKALFRDQMPVRFRTVDVCEWLGVDLTTSPTQSK
jgi:hypothetical protein